jgi:hypothetical protein
MVRFTITSSSALFPGFAPALNCLGFITGLAQRLYDLFGRNTLSAHGEDLVAIGGIYLPVADPLFTVQKRFDGSHATAAINIRFKLKVFCFVTHIHHFKFVKHYI